MKEKLHTLAERLEWLMKRDSVNKSELAKIAGVSHVAAGNWLAGKTPKTDQFYTISQAFDVPMEWLLTGEEYHPRPSVKEAGMAIERDMAAQSPAARAAEDDEGKRRNARNMLALMEENEALKKRLAKIQKIAEI